MNEAAVLASILCAVSAALSIIAAGLFAWWTAREAKDQRAADRLMIEKMQAENAKLSDWLMSTNVTTRRDMTACFVDLLNAKLNLPATGGIGPEEPDPPQPTRMTDAEMYELERQELLKQSIKNQERILNEQPAH